MKYIYTITGVEDPFNAVSHRRCFGWFTTLDEAVDAVETNRCEIRECLYDYMIIEQFSPGLYCGVQEEWWWKWNRKRKKFLRIKKPKKISNVINWGIG